MQKTEFWCGFELKDTTALEDSEASSRNIQEFANLLLLKENMQPKAYGTLEKDFFLLDGSKSELSDMPTDIVYWSESLSDENGMFPDTAELVITFHESHSSCGLTFHFMEDYPLELEVTWLDIYGITLARKVFSVDNLVYFARKQVEDYAKLIIRFTKAKPYRYVKLRYMEYGTDMIMGAGGMPVKKASLIEEMDMISNQIAVNKLTYNMIDEADDFNVGNIEGLHKVLQKGQRITAYEKVNGEDYILGAFFLSDWKTSGNITKISAVDYKGLLDNGIFRTGKVYDGEPAGIVIDAIMAAAGITDYEVLDEVRSVKLYGYMKQQTCRKALREVLFAVGAVIDTARSTVLRIYKPKRKVSASVERVRKFKTEVLENDYVSDVTVKYSCYMPETEKTEIITGDYEMGIYTVAMSAPVAELEINKGTIIVQTADSVTFQLKEAGHVSILGYKYNKQEFSVTASVDYIQAGKTRKEKSFSCQLVNAAQAKKTAEAILEYYSMNLGIRIKYLNAGETAGTWGEVQNNNKMYGDFVAGFEKITTDLTGGFLSNAQLRGYYKTVTDFCYTTELFAGEEAGDL